MQRPSRDAVAGGPGSSAAPNLRNRSRGQTFHLLMFLSGFAGLGYEMVWTRMLSVALGHEIIAVLAVIAAFFTGLALGAYTLDGVVRRSPAPGLWYAALEAVIGLWALALIALIPAFNEYLPRIIGAEPSMLRHWGSVFAGTLLLLLPATAAMGATLPAMERLVSAHRQTGWTVGGLYAANTFGAVAGTMIATFALAPALGFTLTLTALATVNFLCAGAVLVIADRGKAESSPARAAVANPPSATALAALLFLTGLFGIGYEVLVIRVLGQVLENTVFTFASLLSVYLFGTALGAALYQGHAPREDFKTVLGGLLAALSLACTLGVALLWISEPLHLMLADRLGDGYGPAVVGEVLVALLIFLPPTLLMGATFSHLAQAARDEFGVGRAIGLNTLGGALAPLVFGVVLLPLMGSKLLLLLLCAAYLPLIPLWTKQRRTTAKRALTVAGPAAAAAVLLFLPTPLRFVGVPPGGEILSYDEGVMASVAVVRDANDIRFLKVNNHYSMGSSVSRFSDRRQAHIPLLLHRAPSDALFLGLGTGSTFVTSAVHPELSATAVELLPEILPVLEYFGPSAETIEGNKRFRLVTSDARRFVRATDERYDVIIADVFHPSRDGAGSLYTVEHFDAIRASLREDGLFCQWLPLFQLDLPTLQTIVRSFVNVYPDSEAYLAHYSLGQPILGLVGRDKPTDYHRGWLADRVRDRRLAEDLTGVRLNSDFALFGGFLAGTSSLRQFAGDGPLNTDDRPIVTFQAPGFVYAAPEPAWLRLLEVLAGTEAAPADLLGRAVRDEPAFAGRLADYWRARDAYLEAGIRIAPSADVESLLAQIREPLLSVARLSSDFVPAYAPLLEAAAELHKSNPAAARALLDDLASSVPDRPEALALRRQLFDE